MAAFRPIDHDEGQYVGAVAMMRFGLPYRDFAYLQTPLQPLLFAPLAWMYDVPLLVEARSADEFSIVVVVHAPAEQRIERLVARRGMDRASAQNRVAAQASDDERLAVADVIIDTSGSMPHTLEQVDVLWKRLVADRAHHTGVSDPLS